MPEASPTLPLRDIIAPLEPQWWPPAPGWWLVLAVLLIFAGLIVRSLKQHFTYEHTALRKAALRELKNIRARDEISDRHYAEQVSSLLKRVAMVRYADQHPASLSGETWLAFLDQSDSTSHFTQRGGEALRGAQYQPTANIDRNRLYKAAHSWIEAI